MKREINFIETIEKNDGIEQDHESNFVDDSLGNRMVRDPDLEQVELHLRTRGSKICKA